MAKRAGILDEGFLENIPNVLPAGEAPWLRNNPMLTLPAAGEVRPEWNSMWLKPGMLMEPGSGFGSEGRSSALQMPNFPFFPLFGMPGFGVMGSTPPGVPSGDGPTGEGDYLGTALKMGKDILKELMPSSGPATPTFGQNTEGMFGPDPIYDLQGNVTLNGQPPIGDSGIFEGQFGVFPEGLPSVGPEVLESLPSAPHILQSSPLYGGPVGPSLGFGVDPTYNLAGDLLDAGGPTFTLGADTGAGAAAATAPWWAGPAAIAGAGIPALTRLATDDPKTNAWARMGGAGLTAAGVIGSLGTAAPVLGMAGPAASVVALPFVIGQALSGLKHAYGDEWGWGRAKAPIGFLPIPDARGKDSGNYVNPQTGVTISRKGRYAFEPTELTKAGMPPSMEQARQWGIPMPGVDLNFEEMMAANPELAARIEALSRLDTGANVTTPETVLAMHRLRQGRETGTRTPIRNQDVNLLFNPEIEAAQQWWNRGEERGMQ